MGECKKCGMKVKMSSCELSTTVCVVFRPVGGRQEKVTLFKKELESITANVSGSGLEEKLLSVPSVKLCINNRNIATSASTM